MSKKLDKLQADSPTQNQALAVELADVRRDLYAVQAIARESTRRLDGAKAEIEAAKAEMLDLMPEATELAYVKCARIEIKDLRDMLEHHVDEDHKRETMASCAVTSGSRATRYSSRGPRWSSPAVAIFK